VEYAPGADKFARIDAAARGQLAYDVAIEKRGQAAVFVVVREAE
jgi:hypothetical protein